jgi:hypothetical protein
MEIMRGPMNFSTNDDCGFLIEGFENPPLLMTPYNPPYYRDLMEDAGMVKAKDLFAFIYVVCERLPEKIYRVASIAEKRGITVRRINKKRLFSEMMLFKDIYNSAWHRNWGFIPLNDEVLAYTVRSLKSLVREDLMVIAESKGMPVGFLGMIPDYNVVLRAMRGKLNIPGLIKALYYSHRITDLRLLLLGIREEYRNKGVDALMFREGFKGVRAGNYKRVEFSWILEDNIPVIRMAEMIEGQLYKKYRIYEKKINLNIA